MNKSWCTFGKLVSLSLFLGILLTTSCQNEAFIPPYQSDSRSSIQSSIRSGAVLTGSNSIQLDLTYEEDSDNLPHQLEISITDRQGNSLGTQIIEGDQLFEPLPSVTPAEGRKGLFILNLQLYNQNGELLEKKEIPFFKVDSYPQIVQIEAYPPDSLNPQSTGLLLPTVSGGEDAWVRWKMGSALLDKGLLSKYQGGYKWTAPSSEGVYSIKLEVFPEAPPEEEGDFSFQSPESSEVQFYVQERTESRSGELGPEQRYHTLLHLDGSFRNTGMNSGGFAAIGTPLLAVKNGLFGYYFSSDNGIKSGAGEFLFNAPQEAKPFTLTLQFDPAAVVQPEVHLFSALSGDGSALVQLITDALGNPMLYSPSGDQVVQRVPKFDFEGLQELSISFLPNEDNLQVKWYKNGRLIHTGAIPHALFPQAAWQDLQICGTAPNGAYPGCEGLFDEVGLYAFDEYGNPSVDTGIFKRWTQRMLGKRQVLQAEGFEHMPSDSIRVGAQAPQQLAEIKQSWTNAGVLLYLEDSAAIEPYRLQVSPAGAQAVETAVEIPAETLGDKELLQLSFSRNSEALIIANAEGRELYRNVEWREAPLKVELIKSASPDNDEGAGNSPTDETSTEATEKAAPLEVTEVLIVRELSTFNKSDV